jgi:hypothetical protein
LAAQLLHQSVLYVETHPWPAFALASPMIAQNPVSKRNPHAASA